MRALISLLPVLLTLGGCAPDTAEVKDSGEGPTVTTATHIIPRQFRGRWAEEPAACLVQNSRRYEIAAARIDTASFSADVNEVTVSGQDAVARLELDHGTVQFAMTLMDANTMRASYGERPPFTLRMCR